MMINRIFKAVEIATEKPMDEIIRGGRNRNIVIPRQIAMYLIRVHCGHTLQGIGEVFHVNHATVIHAIKCVTNGLVCNDSLINGWFRKITKAMNSSRSSAESRGERYRAQFFAGMFLANSVSAILITYMAIQILNH
jgi:hypothetical protein